MSLGDNIQVVRKNRRMTQRELENKTGIKREYLSKLENDKLKNPTIKTVAKIAVALNVPMHYLLPN